MSQPLQATLSFLLYRWLKLESWLQWPRFTEHSRETFDAILDTSSRIAAEKYAPFNRLVDTEEPRFDGEKVCLPTATHQAWQAYVGSGLLSASQEPEWGGLQLPYTVESAANSFFALASVGISAALLTVGNANLLMAHGTPNQRRVFAGAQWQGRWAGTMCLSEPQAGSSLGDIRLRAVADEAASQDPLGPRYRLKGSKMWISAGEHELTENIVHLVLAKIALPDGSLPPGVGGLSLFVVPKHLCDLDGQLLERNDVALAGLNHKLGWRGTPNTLLNFGEGRFKPSPQHWGPGLDGTGTGAVGYLVGRPGEGLKLMFHMMNEARIAVGLSATMLGLAGFYASLDYARQRPQGRSLGAKADPSSAQVAIIEHADVKRMLLAQKAYGEGALALLLRCASWVDEHHHHPEPEHRRQAHLLLELLTPVAKSWPSQWCLEANSLAIQVHGGYGYTRDFPVEQYWRDNRLNMIHEGTHGIQALDLLGRKLMAGQAEALHLLSARIKDTCQRAAQHEASWAAHGRRLEATWEQVVAVAATAWASGKPEEALANAVPYLQAFGHTVIAWVWLDVALCALADLEGADSHAGRLAAAHYFFHYELPLVPAWLEVVEQRQMCCAQVDPHSF